MRTSLCGKWAMSVKQSCQTAASDSHMLASTTCQMIGFVVHTRSVSDCYCLRSRQASLHFHACMHMQLRSKEEMCYIHLLAGCYRR